MQKNYCGDLVRKHDENRYLISMFAPADRRADLWALFAFNYEIAKTRDVVSDTTLGLIRLQWWRDAIRGVYDGSGVPDHEVLKPLSVAIDKYKLPQEYFDKLIYAREFDLEGVSPESLSGLISYADFTTTPLLCLAMRICGYDLDDDYIRPIAVNYTLAGILMATAHNARQGHVLLPTDLMNKYGLTLDSLFKEEGQVGLASLVKDVVEGRLTDCDANGYPLLKSCVAISDINFSSIVSNRYMVMSPILQRPPAFKVLRVFWKVKCCN
ncbi:MAG: squalene/phytoene synthase family protein [Alphaproteobacteria bacterium]